MPRLFEEHERYVQELLNLSRTVSSGNKFYDPGDAVSREHYRDQAFRLYAECKSTIAKSYSLKRDDLAQYCRRAIENGKKFCLPVRFVDVEPEDYVVLRLIDFSEVLDAAQSPPAESVEYIRHILTKIRNSEIRDEAMSHFHKIVGA